MSILPGKMKITFKNSVTISAWVRTYRTDVITRAVGNTIPSFYVDNGHADHATDIFLFQCKFCTISIDNIDEYCE